MLHTRNNDAEEKERSGEICPRKPTTCALRPRRDTVGRSGRLQVKNAVDDVAVFVYSLVA